MTAAAGPSEPTPEPTGGVEEAVRTGVESATDWAATSLRIAVVVVLAVVLRWLLHRAIRRIVRRAIAAPAVPEALRSRFGESAAIAVERRRQRAQTIGTVLRSVTTIVVFGVAVATVLSELGLDLGPAIAGAGIVGVALGFGAQNLVRDFLNGIFMILEDQYGVGDAVDLGEASGIVESVALRTTRLRSVDGTVWHVRNGEILRVGNQSQGWSRALLDVSVGYGTDIDEASAVIKRVADEVAASEAVGQFVLAEPEVWGVETFAPDGITIRLVVKTAPLEQWKVARELRRRLKEAFDAEGIEIPLPQRSLWIRSSPDAAPQPVTDVPAAPVPAAEREAPTPRHDLGPPRKAIPRPDVVSYTGEADVARADTGALRVPGTPVSPTGPADDGVDERSSGSRAPDGVEERPPPS